MSAEVVAAVLNLMPAVWEIGTVTVVRSTNLDLTVNGQTYTNVHWLLAAATPATFIVGNVVVLLAARNQRLVLGKIS